MSKVVLLESQVLTEISHSVTYGLAKLFFATNVVWQSQLIEALHRIFGKRILPCPGKGLRAFWTWISNFPKHLRCPRAKSYPPSLMSNSPDPEIHWGISHSLLLTDSGCRKPQPIGGQIQS